MERAVYYLGHIDKLYLAASPALKQRFLREVLEEVKRRKGLDAAENARIDMEVATGLHVSDDGTYEEMVPVKRENRRWVKVKSN